MVKTCPRCKKIYAPTPFGVCYDCHNKELEQEDLIRDFLRTNNKASIEQISLETGVGLDIIKKMMRSGRLQGDAQVEYPCEKCKKPITDGRLCKECTGSLKAQMQKIKEKQEEKAPEVKGDTFAKKEKETEAEIKRKRSMYI